MSLLSLSPSWFYGYDVALELCFAIISLIIAAFAFRIYRKTDQQQVRLLGLAFASISIAYFLQSLLNFLIISNAGANICGGAKLYYLDLFSSYGLYAHMLFMTIGLVLLAFMALRTDRLRVMWLLLALSLVAIFSSASPLHTFFLVSSMLLAIIVWHFAANYLRTRQLKTLLVVIAFAFLLFGSLHFMLSVNHEVYYAIGHILELVAYALILTNLYLVLRHDQKA